MSTSNKTIDRRGFIKRAAAVSAGAAFAAAAPSWANSAKTKPNIVFFLVDDMGWMDSTVYGSKYYETPNMERLAKLSMRFTNAYSAAPLCTATRASIMTGEYPGRLHITGASGHAPAHKGPLLPDTGPPNREILAPRCKGYLPLEEYTIGEALKDSGYKTGFIGKWHLGHDPKVWPEYQGFDINLGGGAWPGPPSYFSPYHISNLPDGPDGEYLADRLTDEALKFIDDCGDAPFFLNFWQYAVHAPFQGKLKYREHFEKKKDPRSAQDNAVMGAMIKSMDDSLGRVLDKLEESGMMDNTIIIFSSDNGGNMYDRTMRDGTQLAMVGPEGKKPTNNAPLRSGKATVYEGGIRVPTMFYWPKVVEHGTVSHEIINSIDFYPTMLDMLDIEPKPGKIIDGISIIPALKGKKLKRDTIYGHFPHAPGVPCQLASWVRKGDWKLIRFYQLDENFPDRIELYNLKYDIGEINNLAKVHPQRARKLEAMLDKHLKETGALVPKKNPNYNPNASRVIDDWHPSGQCWLEQGDGALVVNCTGGDPYISNVDVPSYKGAMSLVVNMTSKSKGGGQFFWTTDAVPAFGPTQRLAFAPKHDGQAHEYVIKFPADTTLRSIRLDPSAGPGKLAIDRMVLQDKNGKALKTWDFSGK